MWKKELSKYVSCNCLQWGNYNNAMYKSFTSKLIKLQDNAESSDTFINKAVLTVASYTRTVYYKYNRIPVFYHLPFVFMETN